MLFILNTRVISIMNTALFFFFLNLYTAAAILPIDVEQMWVDQFYYLEGSSLRKADFRQLQIFHEVKSNKILKHVSTRWLSLKKYVYAQFVFAYLCV